MNLRGGLPKMLNITPKMLFDAVEEGNLEQVQYLLSKGADVNATDDTGQTPLLNAAKKGHAAIVTTLLDAHANFNVANDSGETPIMLVLAEPIRNAGIIAAFEIHRRLGVQRAQRIYKLERTLRCQ